MINESKQQIVHESIDGRIAQTSDKRLECRYPGLFITVLCLVPAVLFGLATLGICFIVAIGLADPPLPGSAGAGALMNAWFWFLARLRLRRMGSFVIDVARGSLVWSREEREKGSWPLRDVVFDSAWDPFHRGFGQNSWLLARVPDKRRMRLGKGSPEELDRILELLRDWGLQTAS